MIWTDVIETVGGWLLIGGVVMGLVFVAAGQVVSRWISRRRK